MMQKYVCTECKHLLFEGSLEILMKKRHASSPPYIEFTCPECGHVNRLTHNSDDDLRKAIKPPKPLFDG